MRRSAAAKFRTDVAAVRAATRRANDTAWRARRKVDSLAATAAAETGLLSAFPKTREAFVAELAAYRDAAIRIENESHAQMARAGALADLLGLPDDAR